MDDAKKKNKKKLIFTICLCVLLVIMFILLNTYAFWRVKKEQSDSNYVVGACLKLDFIEEENAGGFTLNNTWPTSDEDGLNTEGYTFTLENTCSESVDYQIVLESLKINGKTDDDYISNDFIKTQLGDGAIVTYSSLPSVDNDSEASNIEEIRETRQLLTGRLAGKSEDTEDHSNKVTYKLKMWISSDADNDQIGKSFRSKIKVYAGQGVPEPEYAITPGSCFRVAENTGTITGFDKNTCGETIVFPATINGKIIDKIDNASSYNGYGYANYYDLSNMSGLKEIGDSAFYTYYAKTDADLVIPNGVTKIGDYAFHSYANGVYGSSTSNKIVFPSSLETIGTGAFEEYHGDGQELYIPDNVTAMGRAAFRLFRGTNLHLPASVTKIYADTFLAYVGTNTTLNIPNSVNYIDNNAFGNFNGNDLILPSNLTYIGTSAFEKYVGENDDLVIPNGVEEYGIGAFRNYNGRSIVLSSNSKKIDAGAFQEYNGANIIIPNTVISIGRQAFKSLDSTKKITFNMAPSDYANVTKGDDWAGQATIVCILNDTEVPCE